jgi:hypothetical protein
MNDPAIAFAVNTGAAAIPDALLVASATVPVALNVPDAPIAGAVKVIAAPGSGLPPASRTTTAKGVAYALPTAALCGLPD